MYSQYDEQKHILAAFAEDYVGRFLDIGAWHPTDKSNTRALYEAGWFGVLIEPSPGPMLNLLKEYGSNPNRARLIQAAVTFEPQLVSMYVSDDAVSTSKLEEYEKWGTVTKFHGQMLVPGITFEQIGNAFGGFDFVNIDAEGLSAQLFLQMLQLGWQPRCVCVEHESKLEMIASAATPLHYRVVYVNGTNAVMVRK